MIKPFENLKPTINHREIVEFLFTKIIAFCMLRNVPVPTLVRFPGSRFSTFTVDNGPIHKNTCGVLTKSKDSFLVSFHIGETLQYDVKLQNYDWTVIGVCAAAVEICTHIVVGYRENTNSFPVHRLLEKFKANMEQLVPCYEDWFTLMNNDSLSKYDLSSTQIEENMRFFIRNFDNDEANVREIACNLVKVRDGGPQKIPSFYSMVHLYQALLLGSLDKELKNQEIKTKQKSNDLSLAKSDRLLPLKEKDMFIFSAVLEAIKERLKLKVMHDSEYVFKQLPVSQTFEQVVDPKTMTRKSITRICFNPSFPEDCNMCDILPDSFYSFTVRNHNNTDDTGTVRGFSSNVNGITIACDYILKHIIQNTKLDEIYVKPAGSDVGLLNSSLPEIRQASTIEELVESFENWYERISGGKFDPLATTRLNIVSLIDGWGYQYYNITTMEDKQAVIKYYDCVIDSYLDSKKEEDVEEVIRNHHFISSFKQVFDIDKIDFPKLPGEQSEAYVKRFNLFAKVTLMCAEGGIKKYAKEESGLRLPNEEATIFLARHAALVEEERVKLVAIYNNTPNHIFGQLSANSSSLDDTGGKQTIQFLGLSKKTKHAAPIETSTLHTPDDVVFNKLTAFGISK